MSRHEATGSRDAHEAADNVRQKVRYVKEEVKPKLRGWLHAATTPLALAAGIVLIVLSPTVTTRVGSAVFAVTALLLFTVSAIYHRGTLVAARPWAILRRFDHSNIFLLIAGSYTPFTLILLEGSARVGLLAIVWAGALLGRGVPDLLDRRAAVGLHADLHGARLGGDLLRQRLRHGRPRRDHPDHRRRRALHPRRGGLRAEGPDPFPRGSASTRCSTPHDRGVHRATTSAASIATYQLR